MTYRLGWVAMAIGLPSWMQGILMDMQVAAMLTELNVRYASAEGVQRTSEWVRSTHWLSPYLLWIGGALTVAGCVLGIIGLIWRKSGDNARTSVHHERGLDP